MHGYIMVASSLSQSTSPFSENEEDAMMEVGSYRVPQSVLLAALQKLKGENFPEVGTSWEFC
jgi:hypothetical protein